MSSVLAVWIGAPRSHVRKLSSRFLKRLFLLSLTATLKWWPHFSSSWWQCCGLPGSLALSLAGILSLKSKQYCFLLNPILTHPSSCNHRLHKLQDAFCPLGNPCFLGKWQYGAGKKAQCWASLSRVATGGCHLPHNLSQRTEARLEPHPFPRRWACQGGNLYKGVAIMRLWPQSPVEEEATRWGTHRVPGHHYRFISSPSTSVEAWSSQERGPCFVII